jgi:hypothetical protein
MRRSINNNLRADFDISVDSFIEDINLRTISEFPMIGVYYNPKDYPKKYVARVFDIRPGEVYATRYIMICDSLEELRSVMPDGFSRMNKSLNDDPELVEVWF